MIGDFILAYMAGVATPLIVIIAGLIWLDDDDCRRR